MKQRMDKHVKALVLDVGGFRLRERRYQIAAKPNRGTTADEGDWRDPIADEATA